MAATLAFFPVPVAQAAMIAVPGDQPTIQAGIAAAATGDIVLVAPGTYTEAIDFLGKAITVESSGGAAVTTIQAPSDLKAVRVGGSSATIAFRGFTVRGSGRTPTTSFGGAIHALLSAGVIERNVITGAFSCDAPGIKASGPVIVRRNVFWGNQHECTGGGLVSIAEVLAGATFSDNLVVGNDYGNSPVGVQGTGVATRNVIAGNSASASGGVQIAGGTFSNNLVVGNVAGGVGGVYLDGGSAGLVVNNTFVDNVGAGYASGLYSRLGAGSPYVVRNNIFDSDQGPILNCDPAYSSTVPTFDSNDFVALGSMVSTGSLCSDPVGTSGNLSVDPFFVDAENGDFHLLPPSPLVDAGSSTAAPSLDADGDSRPLDWGAGPGGVQWDIGFDEAAEAGNTIQTTIIGGPSGVIGTTSPPFTFTSATAGAGFECDVDMAGFVPCTSPFAVTTDDERIYSFRVRATAGTAADRTPATRLFAVDVTPPQTTISYLLQDPANWAAWSIDFVSDEPDSSFECSFDGAAYTACVSPYDVVVSLGDHSLTVRATDSAGNVETTPASASWTAAPSLTETPTDSTPLPRPVRTPRPVVTRPPFQLPFPTAIRAMHTVSLPGVLSGGIRTGISVPVRCDSNQGPTCQVRLTVSARTTTKGTSRKVVLGTAEHVVASGVRTRITVKLNRRAAHLLAKRARLKVTVEGAVVTGGAAKTTATRSYFLRRSKTPR
jgi:Right handed beta helix region